MQQIDEKAQHVEVHHTIEKAGECFSRISPNIPRVFLEVTQHIHGRFDRALENVYRAANTMDKEMKLKCIGEAKDCVFFQYTSFEYLVKTRAITVGQGKVAPMCGFPISTIEKNVDGLNGGGYSVVVCQQTKDEAGNVIRSVDFIKEPTEDIQPKPYQEEWEEYMRNFSEDSLKLESASQEKKAPKKEKNLAKRLLKELEELDMDNLSPMDAFHFVERWKEKVLKDKESEICE